MVQLETECIQVSMGAKHPKKDVCHGWASGAAGAVMVDESARPSLKRFTQSCTSLWSIMPAWAGAGAVAGAEAGASDAIVLSVNEEQGVTWVR